MKKSLTKSQIDYREKLKDPRWQAKRLRIFERDQFTCQKCYDHTSTLNVHHLSYFNENPWDIEDGYLVTLCEDCHGDETTVYKYAIRGFVDTLKSKGFLSTDFNCLAKIFSKIDYGWQRFDPNFNILDVHLNSPVKWKKMEDYYFNDHLGHIKKLSKKQIDEMKEQAKRDGFIIDEH